MMFCEELLGWLLVSSGGSDSGGTCLDPGVNQKMTATVTTKKILPLYYNDTGNLILELIKIKTMMSPSFTNCGNFWRQSDSHVSKNF